MAKRRAFTMVEIMMVLVISTLIFMPAMRLMTVLRKAGHKGFDRLESLNTARSAIERVRRDMYMLCYENLGEAACSRSNSGPVISYTFKAFPQGTPPPGNESVKRVEEITYVFDSSKNTLIRKLRSSVPGANSHETVLGSNISHFAISEKKVFGVSAFVLEVTSKAGVRGEERAELKTTVRSKYQSLVQRHTWQVPNLNSLLKGP